MIEVNYPTEPLQKGDRIEGTDIVWDGAYWVIDDEAHVTTSPSIKEILKIAKIEREDKSKGWTYCGEGVFDDGIGCNWKGHDVAKLLNGYREDCKGQDAEIKRLREGIEKLITMNYSFVSSSPDPWRNDLRKLLEASNENDS